MNINNRFMNLVQGLEDYYRKFFKTDTIAVTDSFLMSAEESLCLGSKMMLSKNGSMTVFVLRNIQAHTRMSPF